jgi:hypothetical protein
VAASIVGFPRMSSGIRGIFSWGCFMAECCVCGRVAGRKGLVCSTGCRYKKNVLVWVLKFMLEHKRLDWVVVKGWVEGGGD